MILPSKIAEFNLKSIINASRKLQTNCPKSHFSLVYFIFLQVRWFEAEKKDAIPSITKMFSHEWKTADGKGVAKFELYYPLNNFPLANQTQQLEREKV